LHLQQRLRTKVRKILDTTQSHPCAKIFAFGGKACTAQTRRRPRRAVGRSSKQPIENLNDL
ncbi:MAG: hypothetical protein ACLRJV_11185, partial [Eubacteriales bacterium]